MGLVRVMVVIGICGWLCYTRVWGCDILGYIYSRMVWGCV